MQKKITILFLLILASWIGANAQTSFTDDFNSAIISPSWVAGSNQYSLLQANGVLKIGVSKYEGWKSFALNLPSSTNLSASPFVNIKVKSDQDITVDVYLVDSSNANKNIRKRISRTEGFNRISWDFTGVTGLDLTKITSLYFAVNGTALTCNTNLEFDEIKVGSSALNLSNFSGIPNQTVFKNSKKNKIVLQNIENTSKIRFASVPALITNITQGNISDGILIIEYDAAEGKTGMETITFQSIATSPWKNNSFTFDLTIANNQAPNFTVPAIFQCKADLSQSLALTAVSDGDATSRQNLNFEVSSDHPEVTGSILKIEYIQDAPTAYIQFTPVKAGQATITVKVNDGQDVNNIVTKTFTVEVFSEWNNPPTIASIKSVLVYNNAGEQLIPLAGISDGDGGTKALSFETSSSDESLIPKPTIEYTSGSIGILKFTPQPGKSGTDTITVTVNDSAGNPNNNGSKSCSVSFTIDVQAPPVTGYIVPLSDYSGDRAKKLWHVEGENKIQTIGYEKEGTEDALKIACTSKSTWDGLWYGFDGQKLDMSKSPYVSMWVKSDQAITFHLYLWDYKMKRNNMSPTVEKSIPANTWTKVVYDFTGKMKDDQGSPLFADKIDSVLFNYHPTFGWPFTAWAGNVWFKDIRLGDQADGNFTQISNCTISDIPDLTLFANSGAGTVELTNISSGSNTTVTVTAKSSNPDVVPDPTVTILSPGKATLAYSLTGKAGKSTITVKVSAEGSTDVSKTFTIDAQTANSVNASTISIDLNTRYQTMRGMGTYVDAGMKSYLQQYTVDLGATAARFGVIGNQIEPVNDNNDPYILDRNALNYKAFDWDFIKELKAKGVEQFLLTIWSVPAWMKKNASEDYFIANALTWEETDNRVDTLMYEEYAEYVVAIVKSFKEMAGVDLNGIGLQNEPAFCEPYPSAILSPELFVKLIRIVGKRFEQEGIKCRLYMAEQVLGIPLYPWSAYLVEVQNDFEAWKYSDVQAVHGYAGDGITAFTADCAQWKGYLKGMEKAPHPKEFWMTETEIPSGTWADIMTNIGAMSTAFSCGNISLWTQWGYTGHYTTQGASNQLTFAESQFAKFVKPGAVRVSATTSNDNILVTSFVNTETYDKNLATVLINKGTSPVIIKLSGKDIPASFDVYQTYELKNFSKTSGGLQKDELFLLPPQSITTFVAQLPNAAPTIDAVTDQVIKNNSGEQMITLTGITDGGEGNQLLSISASVLTGGTAISNLRVEYSSPGNTAKLYFTAVSSQSGNASIKIEVADDGIVNNKSTVNCNIQILSTTSTKEITETGMKVYPNPASGYITIIIPDQTYQTAEVFSLTGQKIIQRSIQANPLRMDITALKSGMYLMLLKGEKGTLSSRFVVK
jgi:O-glycosyl hydrolase